jgi:hypothetical protein
MTEQLMKKLDHDKSGNVSLIEFASFVKENSPTFTDEQITSLFNFLDKDKSGQLSLQEVQYMVSLADSARDSLYSFEVQLVIPGTEGKDPELEERIKEASKQFCVEFGGCSTYPASRGCYLQNGEVVVEKEVIVQTYTTPTEWAAKKTSVIKFVEDKCKSWGKESLGLIVDGTMEFISPSIVNDPTVLIKQLVSGLKVANTEGKKKKEKKDKKDKKEKNDKGEMGDEDKEKKEKNDKGEKGDDDKKEKKEKKDKGEKGDEDKKEKKDTGEKGDEDKKEKKEKKDKGGDDDKKEKKKEKKDKE